MMKQLMIDRIFSWEPPDDGFDEDHVAEAARSMALSDLESMSVDDFIGRSPSGMVMDLVDVIGATMGSQIEEIMSEKSIDDDLDSLGIAREITPVPYRRIVNAVHNNYLRGITALAHYLSIVEFVKEGLDGYE